MPDKRSEPTAFVRAYTVTLVAVALFSAGVAWLEVGLIEELRAQGATGLATLLRVDQVVALLLSPTALLAAIARSRRWAIALLLTRVVSIPLAIVFPIGTAVFVYWLVWVHPREVGALRAESSG